MIAVDGSGRIHITFYDDRDHNQADYSDPLSSAKTRMKVFYTFSDDGVQFEANKRLFVEEDDPEDPPVFDCEHEVALGIFEVGAYMGLTIRNKPGGGYEVWATYTGSLPATSDPDDATLIWASVVPQ